MELVSEYYSYTEEYVLARPYLWMNRKFDQMNRLQYERRRYAQADSFNAQYAILDIKTTGGKNVEKCLLDEYDVMISKERAGLIKDTIQLSSRQPTSAELFNQEDYDPFALMPPEMKERLKQKA